MRAESCGNAPSSRKPQTRAKKRLAFRFCANRCAVQTTLLCSVADRAKPYSERSIARLPNRLLVHNVFSYLADINSVRVNKDMELDTSPPNGIYKAGGIQVTMPSLLIQQWTTELARHAPCLKVLVYEGAEATGGSGKGVCAKDLAEQDVVLMNFETLQSGAKP